MIRIRFPRGGDSDAYRWGSKLAGLPGLAGPGDTAISPRVYAPLHSKRDWEDVDLFINDAAWEIAKRDEELAAALPPTKGPDEELPKGYRPIQEQGGF